KKFTDHYGAKNYLNFKASFGGGAQSEFMSGKVAMVVRNSPFVTELATNAPSLDYGMAPIPTPSGKQGPMSSGGGGFSVEIPKGSAHPKEAFAFAKYFTTEAAAVWVKQQNDFPADKAAVAALSSNPNSMKIAANIKNTFVSPVPVYAPTWDTTLAKAQDDVTINGRDPKAALDEAQQAVLKMVAEGKK
ncbi:MAG TPA: extracellular solute-binding protein, partial [Deinococcales bacterium]|nr:extracellular solute-binding protein [Deinococcales bacterium]